MTCKTLFVGCVIIVADRTLISAAKFHFSQECGLKNFFKLSRVPRLVRFETVFINCTVTTVSTFKRFLTYSALIGQRVQRRTARIVVRIRFWSRVVFVEVSIRAVRGLVETSLLALASDWLLYLSSDLIVDGHYVNIQFALLICREKALFAWKWALRYGRQLYRRSWLPYLIKLKFSRAQI